MSENAVVIVAGGSGTRMKSSLPKQFMEINGLPVLMHTIRCFYIFDPDIFICLVLPKSHFDLWNQLTSKHQFSIPVHLAQGGETRFHSVKNGLARIEKASIIGIHDAVRPLVSQETLKRCYKEARRKGNAVPVMPVKESLRKISPAGNVSRNRAEYVAVQTPQVFLAEILTKAFQVEYDVHFTDDASVVEAFGIPINLVEGNTENIKITDPNDLMIARALLQVPDF